MEGRAAAVAAILLALAPAPLFAQRPGAAPDPAPAAADTGAPAGPQLVDRVVAVVGNQPILLSDVQERIYIQQAQGLLQLPPDSADRVALRRQILQTMIDDEVLYQAARRDTSISVSDADVLNQVNQQAQQVRDQFPSDAAFQASIKAAHFETVDDWRQFLTEQQRRYLYQQRYLQNLREQGKLRPANVTLAELHQAFDQWQKTQGATHKRPPMVSFEQIVIAPQPTAAAKALALARADSVLAQLRHGADFATLARRYSDDPGTRDQGGELGWFRRGGMVQAFENAAFNAKPGEVVGPILTPFGYHLIEVQKRQPGEVEARHILFTPAIDSANLAAAAARAKAVETALQAGANFDSLAKLYADTSEQVHVDSIARSQLLPLYAAAFANATVGQVVPPFAINPESPNRTKFVVAELTDIEPERPYTFDDLRDQLRQQLAQEKSMQELLRQLKSQTYVSIEM